MRHLTLFLGSDVFSASVTLAVFMGGLSLGSYFISSWIQNLKFPLIIFGIIEIVIGIYGLSFSDFLYFFHEQYAYFYREYFDTSPVFYKTLKVGIASSALLFPTLLMGSTLPLMVKNASQGYKVFGDRVSSFYGINTFGAFAGTLVAGFVFLPYLGVQGTTVCATLINILTGSLAVSFHKFLNISKKSYTEDITEQSKNKVSISLNSNFSKTLVLIVFFVGLVGLGLEIVWMRILVQSFSATVYSYTIMVSSFLLGIFLGSFNATKWIDFKEHLLIKFFLIIAWLACAISSLGLLSYFSPKVFGQLFWGLANSYLENFWVAAIISKIFIAWVLILVPAMMLGVLFPMAVKLYASVGNEHSGSVGRIYAVNTAGAVIGSILAGFFFLTFFGPFRSLIILAVLLLICSLLVANLIKDDMVLRFGKLRVFAPFVLTILFISVLSILPRELIFNFNYEKNALLNTVYSADGAGSSINISKTKDGILVMAINGNIEADTSLSQRRHFILKGHLPLLIHPNPRRVAVVGLGLGITLRAIERHPGIETIDVIELTSELVQANKYLKDWNQSVLSSSKVSVRIDDGRNFMAMTDKTYDMITADPIHPRVTGAGFLYTKEYYNNIKNRLNTGGIVCQWMPMYLISKKSFEVAFSTFAEVFPNASFWYVRSHGLFIGSRDDFKIDFKLIQDRMKSNEIRTDLKSIGIKTPEHLMSYLLLDQKAVHRYLINRNDKTLNTDDNAYLEYKTPFEYFSKKEELMLSILPFAKWNPSEIKNLPNKSLEIINSKWKRRKSKIIRELSKGPEKFFAPVTE